MRSTVGDAWRAMPFLPKLILVMSVPLYLGYLIKHFLLPRVAFLVLHNWAIVSFLIVPLLCLAECIVLARAALPGSGERRTHLRAHLLGLGAGVAAVITVFLVRTYG